MDSNYHTFLNVHTRLRMASVGGVRVRKRQVSSGCGRGEGGHPPPFLPGTATTEACPGSCSNWTKKWKILFRNFSEFFFFPVSVSSASASVAAHSLKRAKNQELSFLLRSLFRLKHLTRKVASQENWLNCWEALTSCFNRDEVLIFKEVWATSWL